MYIITPQQLELLNEKLVDVCVSGKVALVERYLAAGAEIDYMGQRPLIFAARHGHIKIIQVLEKHGADVDEVLSSMMNEASFEDHLEVIKYLCENYNTNYFLYNTIVNAGYNHHYKIVQYVMPLYHKIGNINGKKLAWCLSRFDTESFKFFIQYADPIHPQEYHHFSGCKHAFTWDVKYDSVVALAKHLYSTYDKQAMMDTGFMQPLLEIIQSIELKDALENDLPITYTKKTPTIKI